MRPGSIISQSREFLVVEDREMFIAMQKPRSDGRTLQSWFGFEEPQAIYKWQKGKSLPSIDNLYALGALLEVSLEEILVPCRPQLNTVIPGQQEQTCCPPLFSIAILPQMACIVIKPLVQ